MSPRLGKIGVKCSAAIFRIANSLCVRVSRRKDSISDAKFETIFEMGRRVHGAQIGVVTTAAVSDATPAAVNAHTSSRYDNDAIVDQFLDGVTSNYTWTKWDGADVLFGGGGADFLPRNSNGNVSKIERWQERGYQVVHDNTSLHALGTEGRALGLFSSSTMPVWLDRNVFTDNLASARAWNGSRGLTDVPGLKDMTLKALDIVAARAKAKGVPFMMMSEAASIDKQMHAHDYDRALGDALELDATVRATLQRLEELGELDNTLLVVTADHGHGFDVFGSADTEVRKGCGKSRFKMI